MDPIAPQPSPCAPSMLPEVAPEIAPFFLARINPDDFIFDAPSDLPLLVSAEQAGFDMASSCRNGTCRTCLCQLSSGEVTYRIEWPGLSPEEKAENYILPCVAYPLSDVVIDRQAI